MSARSIARLAHVRCSTETWGQVVLRLTNKNDLEAIRTLLQDSRDAEGFMLRCIHGQILKPKVSLEQLGEAAQVDLHNLAYCLMNRDELLFSQKEVEEGVSPAVTFRRAVEAFLTRPRPTAKTLDTTEAVLAAAGRADGDGVDLRAWYELLAPGITAWREYLNAHHELYADIHMRMTVAPVSLRDAQDVLERTRWLLPLSPGAIDSQILAAIAGLRGTETAQLQRAVDDLMVENFTRNNDNCLKRMLENWDNRPLLKNRMPAIESCYRVITRRDPELNPPDLVTPAIMVQIAGVQADILDKLGFRGQGRQLRDSRQIT